MAGISGWQLLILLIIVAMVFGTKRLRNIGSDLGSAVKGFRKGMEDEPQASEPEKIPTEPLAKTSAEESSVENEPSNRPAGTDV